MPPTATATPATLFLPPIASLLAPPVPADDDGPVLDDSVSTAEVVGVAMLAAADVVLVDPDVSSAVVVATFVPVLVGAALTPGNNVPLHFVGTSAANAETWAVGQALMQPIRADALR